MADPVSERALGVANETTPREEREFPSLDVAPESRIPQDEDFPRPFGRYELRSLLGRGGMGAVYLAHDPHLDRLVALKIPRPFGDDPVVWRERFQAEARAAATLNHPNICPVFEVGEVGAQPYLTMAYIVGETLAARVRRMGPPPIPDALALVRAVAWAMAEAHDWGIVHRDLKPANLMIDRRGQPVVMDFGLALRSATTDDLRLTLSGVAMGTPAYMPPEQAGGDQEAIGPPADVYALGTILFELVTGRVPFRGRTFGKLLAQIERDPPPRPSSLNPDIHPALDTLILKTLEKAPEDRFATATTLADALDSYLDSARVPAKLEGEAALRCSDLPTATYTPGSGRPRLSAEPSKPAGRRSRGLAIATGVLGFILIALLGMFLYVKTDYGELVVELSDPTAMVDVKVNGQEVTLDPEGDAVRIRAGVHQMLEVSGADFEATSESFDLKRGGKIVVRVRLEPKVDMADQPPGLPLVTKPEPPEPRPPSKPVELPKRATLVELPGWQILTDATKDEMREWLDARKKDRHTVTWLDAVQVEDEPVFAGIAALDDRETRWVAFVDLTAAEINDVNLLSKRLSIQDYLIRSISGYPMENDVASVALFHPGHRVGGAVGIMQFSFLSQNRSRIVQEGQVARLIRPFPAGGDQLLCAVYVESATRSQPLPDFDLSETELTDQLETYRNDGYRPVSVVAYENRGERRFTTTFELDPTKPTWELRRDMTADDLKSQSAELAEGGAAPASITAYPWDGSVRYAVVWVTGPSSQE